MQYQIQNERLQVRIDGRGAELQSIKGADGTEYLWQGDQTYWGERAPILFPFCGRFWQGQCTDEGVPCDPGMHGFFRHCDTEMSAQGNGTITLTLCDTPQTRARYPYEFRTDVTYALAEDRLTIRVNVSNTGTRTLPFGLGLHPGYALPFAGGDLSDYTVRFVGAQGEIRRIAFDAEQCFPVGGDSAFPLRDGEFFDPTDAFFAAGSGFFCDMPHTVSLEKIGTDRRITVEFTDYRYVGFWRVPGGKFLCIEPWTSMPATHGESTELTQKADLVRLAPGESRAFESTVTFS